LSEDVRRTPLDLAEGLHLAHAAATLHALGILAELRSRSTAEALAGRFGVDREVLDGTLAYLAARTNIVTRNGDCYALDEGYDDGARFLLDLHVRAFAPVSADLATVLQHPQEACARVDRGAQAAAFADDAGDAALAGILRQLGFATILELGCGTGALLRALARADPRLAGVGVDTSSAMCRVARDRIRAEGLETRLRIVQGDARDPHACLPADTPKTAAVVARDFLNELCRGGGHAAIAWLRRLRALLPGRVLVVADYYGQLGWEPIDADRRILLHDFVQLISGQGVPPPDLNGWAAMYDAADCELAHAIEDPRSARFVHLVRL
jgi:SAM-dependent methyltransferase